MIREFRKTLRDESLLDALPPFPDPVTARVLLMHSFHSSLFSAWLVPDILGFGFGGGNAARGPCAAFAHFPFTASCMSLLTVLTVSALVAVLAISHLDDYDWSPGFWFHHMATPASGRPLYATCLFPSGPRLKPSSGSSLPIGESLASKQSIGLSGPGACSLSHPYLWTLPAPTIHSKKHEPNY